MTDTAVRDDILRYFCRRQICGLYLTKTAFRECPHQDLIGFELRRFDGYFDAIRQRPFGYTQFLIFVYALDFAFARRFLNQFGIDGFLCRRLDRQIAQTVQGGQNRFFCRDVHAFFLRAGDGYGRVRMNQGFSNVIYRLQRNHRQNGLHKLIFPLCARHYFTVLEMTDTFARQGDILAGVALVVEFLHCILFLAFYAIQFRVGKTVTVHFLELEEKVVECFRLTSLFGDGDAIESVHFLRCFAIIATGSGERSFRVKRQLREAVIEHIAG